MHKKAVSGIVLMLLLTSMLSSAFDIQQAKAGGTIYIRADGSIEPLTANITSLDNVTYTFTGNNYDSIVIERANIVVDGMGFTLQTSSGNGISLSYQNNVTIKKLNIDAAAYAVGVYLYYSSNNTISNCNIYLSSTGISIDHSSYNKIYGNNITRNSIGVDVSGSEDYTHNLIHNNILASNNDYGINLGGAYNSVYWNNVTDNEIGISIVGDSHNVYGNNVTRNTRQNGEGITISSPGGNCNVSYNYVAENTIGIFLQPGVMLIYKPNTLKANVMVNNSLLNFGILNYRAQLAYLYNDMDTSNTVDGKPIYYWIDRENNAVPSDAGFVALVNCRNVTVENLTLERNLEGVLLAYSSNCIISGNNITDNGHLVFGGGGIVLYRSSNNLIHQNNVATSHWTGHGIMLDTYSSSNTISENNLTKNDLGIWFFWSNYNNFSKNNMENNTKGVLLDYSANNTINHNDIVGSGDYAIQISAKFNNISINNIVYCKQGIQVYSDANIIVGNNIMENYQTGVFLYTGVKNNVFFHNNFIDNVKHVTMSYSSSGVNSWNNSYPSGGNYWSGYEDKYPNATELDNSGVWNTPYIINENNIDHYPLMSPTEPITRSFAAYDNLKVEVCSNSSISEFQFNATGKTLSFNVTGPAGTSGFCIVIIPANLLWGDFSLFINGFPLVEDVNYTKTYNGTHYTFHITYTHSEHMIEIIGTEVIPEFPSAIILPLFMVLSVTAIVFAKKNLQRKHKMQREP